MTKRRSRPNPEQKLRHVLIAGLAMYGLDAGILSGIFRYSKMAGAWVIHDAGHTFENLGLYLSQLPVEGVIANITTTAVADLLRRTRIPLVNTSDVMPDILEFPFVGVDDRHTGRVAAQHFIDRHFRHLAVVPERGNCMFSRERVAGFLEYANRSGHGVYMFDESSQLARFHPLSPWDPRGPLCTLSDLPKPIGIYACTDRIGFELCRRCLQAEFRVPDDVAILGTDDVEYICETAYPPLSSLRLPAQQIGFSAARMLDQMMRGEPPGQRRITYPAIDVHLRKSTDTVAVLDDMLANALMFIRENCDRRFAAIDVIGHCGMNRRTLERKFRLALRRSILQEIQRVRVSKAASLLIETNEPMDWVAKTVGFRNKDHMDKTFRAVLKKHPRDVRKAFVIK